MLGEPRKFGKGGRLIENPCQRLIQAEALESYEDRNFFLMQDINVAPYLLYR